MVMCSNPLSRWLGSSRPKVLADLLGMPVGTELSGIAQRLTAASEKRLMVIQFAVIAAANERAIDLDNDIWRWGQPYGEVARAAAAAWVGFLGTIGYTLSPIERAFAEHREYTGDDASAATGDDTPEHTGERPATDPAATPDTASASEPEPVSQPVATETKPETVVAQAAGMQPDATDAVAPVSVLPTARDRTTRNSARRTGRPADGKQAPETAA
ncbi:hypothetical protein [Dactylosporangium darangshiense]